MLLKGNIASQTLGEQHLMHALSLKTDTGGNCDWELIATRYDYLQDMQRSPAGVTISARNDSRSTESSRTTSPA